jgi:hypothetical protein
MTTLIELHDKAVADAVAAAIANKGDRDLPSRAALVQGIESLQAEVELLTQGWKACTAVLLKAQGERDTLRAELAALDDVKGAEPVAWLIDGDYTTAFPDIADAHKRKGCVVTPLYAGSAPQAQAPEPLKYPDLVNCPWCNGTDRSVRPLRMGLVKCAHDWHTTGAAPQAPAPLTKKQADKIALDVMGFAVLDKEQNETALMIIRATEKAHGITEAQG